MIDEVIPLWSKEFGPTHQNISVLLQNRGEAFAKKRQFDLAEKDLRGALRLRLQYLAAKNPTIASTENSLANVLIEQKQYSEAEQLLKRALEIRTDTLGPDHPSVARNLNALSVLYSDLLGPVDALIKDKHDLAIVPAGSLTALPFHLLVTEKPDAAAPDAKDIDMNDPSDPSNADPAYWGPFSVIGEGTVR